MIEERHQRKVAAANQGVPSCAAGRARRPHVLVSLVDADRPFERALLPLVRDRTAKQSSADPKILLAACEARCLRGCVKRTLQSRLLEPHRSLRAQRAAHD